MGRRTGGSINAVTRVITDYAPDPVGIGLFGRLSSVHQLGISGHDGNVMIGDKGEPSRTFNGDLGGLLQRFTGAGALALALQGGGRPVVPTSGTLDQTVSQDFLNDPALRVFAARARRQSAGMLG